MISTRHALGLFAVVVLGAACSAQHSSGFFTTSTGAGTGGSGTGSGTNGTGATATGVGGINPLAGSNGPSTGTGMSTCMNDPNTDGDGDGWTAAEGDCNDCDPNVNPGAVDVPPVAGPDGGIGPEVDSDCDGVFNPPKPCDSNLPIDDAAPISGANAVELCQQTMANPPTLKQKTWGVLQATWVLPDGSPLTSIMSDPNGFPPNSQAQDLANYALGHGMLSGFGPNVHVQAGKRMLGLSSGTARQPTDPGYQDVSGFDKGYISGSPMGFPKESPACPGVITGQPHDGAALEVEIRTPTNATGFTFDFNFFTYEWPDYVCSMYNDFFVSLLTPIPMGQTDGNISFDSQGNPVSVNNAFLEVCGCGSPPPCQAGGKNFTCSLGDSGLVGTGFGQDTAGSDHGSTGWLVTKAPVKGGENITIRWTVYDSGDGVLDTSTLIDNWQWIATPGKAVVVGTNPVPTPQ